MTRNLSFDDFGDVLNVEECAQLLRVSKTSLYEAIREGRLPGARKLGRRILVIKRTLMQEYGYWEER